MQTEEMELISLADPADVVEAWSDVILYTDAQGIVVDCNDEKLNYLPEVSPVGTPFWDVLALDTESLGATIKRFSPLRIHEISCCDGRSFLLRIIPLSSALPCKGGYVIIATDNRPMEALYESYEERLEDNIAAWSDSITLFNALFDAVKDSTFLLDESGMILAANRSAQKQNARSEQRLSGKDCNILFGKRFHAPLRNAMHVLKDKERWTKNVVAIDGEGEGYPAEVTLRKISFQNYSLFQLNLHDLTAHVELEEDLQEKEAQVLEKEIALKQVIQSVEAERRELREQLTDQVKKQMLPALERITSSETAEIRESYKTVIEDQLVDMANDPSGEFDSDLLRLSPREMEVCQLIQLGRSGKEIANLLNMSFETVQTHRKNIRRKLELQGKKVSLFSYLRQKPSLI